MTETSVRVFKKWEGKVVIAPKTLLTPTATDQMHPAVRALMDRERMVFGTPKCMAKRRLSISATDFNTLVHNLPIRGGNKYRNTKKLTIQKLGLGTRTFSPACAHGTFTEPEALRVYELVTGNKLVKEDIGFCRGPPDFHSQDDYIMPEFVGATPDGVCAYIPVLVEIKCPFWKKLIEGGIPDIYWSQIQCQMAVTGIQTVHFVRYISPDFTHEGEINIIEAKFDKVWWNAACKEAIKFYSQLAKIRSGALPVPTLPAPRRPRKKSPVEAQGPQFKKCRLIPVSASAPKLNIIPTEC
jgi:hypothetical protein